MLNKRFILLAFLFLGTFGLVYAQEISPKGRFLSDSIRLGDRLLYTMSVKYPRNMQLIFPDSSYNFYPFEYLEKTAATTKSDPTFSYDSVTYVLTTFELDKTQKLGLPVFILNAGDSLPIFAEVDSVYLIEVIPAMADTLALKENTEFREVSIGFNYPIIFIGLAGILVVVLGTWMLFGKIIQEKIKLYKLKKAHARFKERYIRHLDELKNNKHQNPEEILIFWKKYMEDLENRPYTKQTSKEIVINTDNDALRTSLRSIDRSIYGNFQDQDLIQSFQILSDYSENSYQKKVEEVLHG